MRTQKHSTRSDFLGRYYTNASVSKVLVNTLPILAPKTVLDLGSGDGSLSLAASERWSSSQLITVDVDRKVSKLLPRSLSETGFVGGHAHLLKDALSLNLSTSLPQGFHKPDVAVCNPPFIVPKWRKTFGELLEDAGLNSCIPTIATTDAAVLFLAQNLRLLGANGYLGIIVPDSIVSAEKYFNFRAELLSKYSVLRAMRLSRGSFGGTDALAHILIIGKNAPTSKTVQLSALDDEGNEIATLSVDILTAAKRLDYKFHHSETTVSGTGIRLKDVCIDLRRGSLNSAEARQTNRFVLHTTEVDISQHNKWVNFDARRFRFPKNEYSSALRAKSGDILVARVGRGLADKVFGVSSGEVVLSDCLYRLQVLPSVKEQVLNQLCSDRGRKWFEAHAYGVAARQLTKTDLLNFPLDLK